MSGFVTQALATSAKQIGRPNATNLQSFATKNESNESCCFKKSRRIKKRRNVLKCIDNRVGLQID